MCLHVNEHKHSIVKEFIYVSPLLCVSAHDFVSKIHQCKFYKEIACLQILWQTDTKSIKNYKKSNFI